MNFIINNCTCNKVSLKPCKNVKFRKISVFLFYIRNQVFILKLQLSKVIQCFFIKLQLLKEMQ